jgi:hypothetical protein
LNLKLALFIHNWSTIHNRNTDGGYLGAQPPEDNRIQAVSFCEFAHIEVIGVQPNDELIRFIERRRTLVDHLNSFWLAWRYVVYLPCGGPYPYAVKILFLPESRDGEAVRNTHKGVVCINGPRRPQVEFSQYNTF